MAVPPAPDEDSGLTDSSDSDFSAESSTGERSGATTFRVVLLGVLVVALLASCGTLVWLLAGRRGEAADVQSERETVMAQTDQFLLRMGTYGPDLLDSKGQMPEYRSRVKEVITPKFATSFDQQAAIAERLVAQGGVSREAQVFATGVSSIDSDSATALVAGTFTDTYKKGGQQEPAPFRLEVDLVKTEGTWLVDDFTPVTGEAQ